MTATLGRTRQEAALDVLRGLMAVKGWIRDLSRTVYLPHATSTVLTLALVEQHAPARVGQLAEHANVDGSVISRQLAQLEAEGLLHRTPDPSDGRAHQVGLTARGAEALALGLRQMEAVVTERLADWDPDELTRLAADLRRLLANLHG